MMYEQITKKERENETVSEKIVIFALNSVINSYMTTI